MNKQKQQDKTALADNAGVRIDKWLWAARFFKTRSLASEAVSGGKVLADGQRCKASRTIKTGTVLRISKGDYVFEVTVLGLSDKRGPASVAQTLYSESDESRERRETLAESLRDVRLLERGIRGEGRPSKKQRRQLNKLKEEW
ncbi:RNA-binding S4 domain-containing protein [Granulosicoccaceae sp. 1_MG-2023]|nr:RNA-binding S4 domain-containing protein [Granulosicoccaceae sp. 1_MG-2023]